MSLNFGVCLQVGDADEPCAVNSRAQQRRKKRDGWVDMCVNESDLVRLSMEHMLKLSANCSVRLRVRVRECDSVMPSIKIHEDLSSMCLQVHAIMIELWQSNLHFHQNNTTMPQRNKSYYNIVVWHLT